MSSDWKCFQRAKQGDEAAWRELVATYQPRLAALALFVTGSSMLVDDIVQETFVRALGARVSHQSGTVHSFLGTIAYRLAVKESQRTQRNVALTDDQAGAERPDPLERMLRAERDRQVAEVIRELSAEQRQVLVLRLYGEHSYEEIAQTLQVPLGTVKSRMFNAVKSCREALRRRGVLE
ncbi:MAG: RNA polymerase sigma factor [bacterium]